MNISLNIDGHDFDIDYFTEEGQKETNEQPGFEPYVCIDHVFENGDDVTDIWAEIIYEQHYELLKDAVFHMEGE
ncbi:MAG: hypothetical protein GY710_06355 [Desulfobacteraceae bacterium]|nr:hypothetical protein [Desulfobacteraceae bacterium]